MSAYTFRRVKEEEVKKQAAPKPKKAKKAKK